MLYKTIKICTCYSLHVSVSVYFDDGCQHNLIPLIANSWRAPLATCKRNGPATGYQRLHLGPAPVCSYRTWPITGRHKSIVSPNESHSYHGERYGLGQCVYASTGSNLDRLRLARLIWIGAVWRHRHGWRPISLGVRKFVAANLLASGGRPIQKEHPKKYRLIWPHRDDDDDDIGLARHAN